MHLGLLWRVKHPSCSKIARCEVAKYCRKCGRKKHFGLCNLAELEDGTLVHASRIKDGMVDGLRVKNRWIKIKKGESQGE